MVINNYFEKKSPRLIDSAILFRVYIDGLPPLRSPANTFAGFADSTYVVTFAVVVLLFQASQDKVRERMDAAVARQRVSVERQMKAVRAKYPAQFEDSGFGPSAGDDLPQPPPGCKPMSPPELSKLIRETAEREGLTPDLLRAVMHQESAFNPCAISKAGARGMMQLMPSTIQQFKVEDPFDPRENVAAGSKLLKQLITRYGGDLSLALSAYNAGPGRVDAAKGVPLIPETIDYVSNILDNLKPSGIQD